EAAPQPENIRSTLFGKTLAVPRQELDLFVKPVAISCLFVICLIFSVLSQIASAQHISVDKRLSPAQTLGGPNYLISAKLGLQVRTSSTASASWIDNGRECHLCWPFYGHERNRPSDRRKH